jgi:hypothetical protein
MGCLSSNLWFFQQIVGAFFQTKISVYLKAFI